VSPRRQRLAALIASSFDGFEFLPRWRTSAMPKSPSMVVEQRRRRFSRTSVGRLAGAGTDEMKIRCDIC